MPINANQSDAGKKVKIAVTGSFDFSLQREFRDAYRNAAEPGVEFRVNLRGADYMDSSALGMLLLLKEHAEACKGKVIIESATPEIKRILINSKFDRLFTIEP